MIAKILGWDEKQWDIASKYFNLCHAEKATALDFVAMALDCLENHHVPDETVRIMRFWTSRRQDMPGESNIELFYYPKPRGKHASPRP